MLSFCVELLFLRSRLFYGFLVQLGNLFCILLELKMEFLLGFPFRMLCFKFHVKNYDLLVYFTKYPVD